MNTKTKESNVEEVEAISRDIPVEYEKAERKYDLTRIAIIIIAAVMAAYGAVSIASYVCNWASAILIITVGIGTFCVATGLIGIFAMIFFWD